MYLQVLCQQCGFEPAARDSCLDHETLQKQSSVLGLGLGLGLAFY